MLKRYCHSPQCKSILMNASHSVIKARHMKNGIGMKVLHLQLIIMKMPTYEGMKGESEPAFIKGRKHDHLVVPETAHFPLALQSPPQDILRGDEPFVL
jgi:hypothetical protein